jgi:RNA polymerase sigma-70 factor (ECF subfamily)
VLSTALSEDELLNGCISGDKKRWDTFVQQYSNLIYHTIHQTLRVHEQPNSTDDVNDLFQEIFSALLKDNCKKLRIFDPSKGRSLASWLRLIATRLTINHIKKARPLTALEDLPIEPSHTESEDPLIDEESQNCLSAALEALSTDDKLLLELSYVREIPAKIIAQMLNISIEAFYTRKNRVINKLKKITADRNIL